MSVHGMTDQFGAMRFGDPPHQGDPYGGQSYQSYNQGGTPATQYSGGPPQPSYQPPSDKPPLPQGWTPHFDQQYQRWYYVEGSTGKSQWEAPGYYAAAPPPPVNSPPTQYQDGYGPPAGPPAGGAYAGYDAGYNRDSGAKKGSGAGGMMLGAAGGLAAGAVGGAVLHHVLSDGGSDDERRDYVTNNQYNSYGAPPVAYENRSDSDDSDRESLVEAREDLDDARGNYRETLEDSSASSSDVEEAQEELEEAEDEYEEEYDDYYDDD